MNIAEGFRQKESDPRGRVIRFEEGIHPDKAGPLLQEIDRGNPNAFAWNSAVSTRMRTYSPDYVAIDGLEHFSQSNEIAIKRAIWISLPARPSKLNSEGRIYVVAGDNALAYLQDSVTESSLAAVGRNLLFVGAGATAGVAAQKGAEGVIDHQKEPKPTRRQFLGYVGALTGYGLASAVHLTAQSPWPSTQQVLRGVSNSLEPLCFLSGETVIKGRTALLIAKMEDALKYLPPQLNSSSVGSIVMGSAHTFDVDEMLSSKEKRAKYIRAYAQMLMERFVDIDRKKERDYFGDLN
ncbi:MAG TPA: hypothetical protein VNA13_04705, partial [Xanthomonadales bacterium]|nr:hypothetical protein [Xanthomonadales bacterium]